MPPYGLPFFMSAIQGDDPGGVMPGFMVVRKAARAASVALRLIGERRTPGTSTQRSTTRVAVKRLGPRLQEREADCNGGQSLGLMAAP